MRIRPHIEIPGTETDEVLICLPGYTRSAKRFIEDVRLDGLGPTLVVVESSWRLWPIWRRDWNRWDIETLQELIDGRHEADKYLLGHSDGATLTHAVASPVRHRLAYAGLWTGWLDAPAGNAPCTLVMNADEPHRKIRNEQPRVLKAYHNSGIDAEIVTLSNEGFGHEWNWKENARLLRRMR